MLRAFNRFRWQPGAGFGDKFAVDAVANPRFARQANGIVKRHPPQSGILVRLHLQRIIGVSLGQIRHIQMQVRAAYAPRFSCPFTVGTSSEKTSPPLEREIGSWERFKTLRETVFARRVLFKRKIRTFQNAIPSSKLAFDRNTAAIRKNATIRTGLSLLRVREALRTQISHAVGMAANRPRLVDVMPFEKRTLKRGINRPYRRCHMRLRRTLETIGVAFES